MGRASGDWMLLGNGVSNVKINSMPLDGFSGRRRSSLLQMRGHPPKRAFVNEKVLEDRVSEVRIV